MIAGEVKELLKIYADIPRMIDEEFAVIRNCEEERNRVTPPSAGLSGMPSGKGRTGGRTARAALSERERYYDEEVRACSDGKHHGRRRGVHGGGVLRPHCGSRRGNPDYRFLYL